MLHWKAKCKKPPDYHHRYTTATLLKHRHGIITAGGAGDAILEETTKQHFQISKLKILRVRFCITYSNISKKLLANVLPWCCWCLWKSCSLIEEAAVLEDTLKLLVATVASCFPKPASEKVCHGIFHSTTSKAASSFSTVALLSSFLRQC